MGRSRRPGVYPAEDGGGWQINALYKGQRIRRRGFTSAAEAEDFLTSEKDRIRRIKVLGEIQRFTVDQAAAHYIRTEAERGKVSLETDIHLLKRVVATIGDVPLDRVSQETIKPFVEAARKAELKNKSINNAIAVLIRICRLAAQLWRDENGRPWLATQPMLQKLPLNDQRAPRPITWAQQSVLMPLLPLHLGSMVLFDLNTGARDDVVCQLRWQWEVQVPLDKDQTISVFIVPKRYVKGRKAAKVLVCNSIARSIIDAQRGKNAEFVFVYRRKRISRLDEEPRMPYRPIERMSNSGWETARRKAGLGDLHIHDLRHTVGMRLREAGVAEATVADVLWHSRQGMTAHYSVAQVREVYNALEKITTPGEDRNVSLLSLVSDGRFNQNLTGQRKTA